MTKTVFALPLLLLLAATPAHATGGFDCRTGGVRPIQVSLGFGHVAGAPLLQDATRLTDNGRPIPVAAPQWWFDGTELRLLLTDRAGQQREAFLKAVKRGPTYDGSIWRHGQRRRIRCREG